MSSHQWKQKLDAYADGELPEQELRDFEVHLRTCPECAMEALNRTQLKRATRAAAEMRFKASPELRQRIATIIAPKRRPLAFLFSPALAAAVALVLIVTVSTFLLSRRSAREQALSELVDLHVSTLASANPVDVVSSDRHTVKPWFQGKLPFTFNLPELEGSQFKLNGGKLVYFRSQPAAHLIYELRKHEFSVFIVQDSEAPAGIGDENKNGFSTESWTSAGLRYVILSDAGPADVHSLGDLLRTAQRP